MSIIAEVNIMACRLLGGEFVGGEMTVNRAIVGMCALDVPLAMNLH